MVSGCLQSWEEIIDLFACWYFKASSTDVRAGNKLYLLRVRQKQQLGRYTPHLGLTFWDVGMAQGSRLCKRSYGKCTIKESKGEAELCTEVAQWEKCPLLLHQKVADVIIHAAAKGNGQKLTTNITPLLCQDCESKQIMSYSVREGIPLLIVKKLHQHLCLNSPDRQWSDLATVINRPRSYLMIAESNHLTVKGNQTLVPSSYLFSPCVVTKKGSAFDHPFLCCPGSHFIKGPEFAGLAADCRFPNSILPPVCWDLTNISANVLLKLR